VGATHPEAAASPLHRIWLLILYAPSIDAKSWFIDGSDIRLALACFKPHSSGEKAGGSRRHGLSPEAAENFANTGAPATPNQNLPVSPAKALITTANVP